MPLSFMPQERALLGVWAGRPLPTCPAPAVHESPPGWQPIQFADRTPVATLTPLGTRD